jgi:hypothetical protein
MDPIGWTQFRALAVIVWYRIAESRRYRMRQLSLKGAANFLLDSSKLPFQYIIQLVVAVNDTDGTPCTNLGVDSFLVSDVAYETLNPLVAALQILSVENIQQGGDQSAFYKVKLSAPDQMAQVFPNILLVTAYNYTIIGQLGPYAERKFELTGQGTAVIGVGGIA